MKIQGHCVGMVGSYMHIMVCSEVAGCLEFINHMKIDVPTLVFALKCRWQGLPCVAQVANDVFMLQEWCVGSRLQAHIIIMFPLFWDEVHSWAFYTFFFHLCFIVIYSKPACFLVVSLHDYVSSLPQDGAITAHAASWNYFSRFHNSEMVLIGHFSWIFLLTSSGINCLILHANQLAAITNPGFYLWMWRLDCVNIYQWRRLNLPWATRADIFSPHFAPNHLEWTCCGSRACYFLYEPLHYGGIRKTNNRHWFRPQSNMFALAVGTE